MFKILERTKGGIFKVSDVYYAKRRDDAINGEDVIYFNQCKESYGEKKAFHTLHIDLTLSQEELLKAFDRRTRTDIRKVRDTGMIVTHFTTDVSDAEIKEFIEYYNNFAATKGIAPVYKELVEAVRKSGNLCLTKACYGKTCEGITCKQEDILCMHMYLMDEDRSRVLYSASSRFDFDREADKHFVARGNRLLHFDDMMALKEHGISIYDFGGLFLDEDEPSHTGIDRFKKGFGGEVVDEFSYPYPVTAKGALYLKLKELVKKD